MPKSGLVDMAYTKAELKEEKKEMSVGYGGEPNPYPWGLCLSLEEKELDKLGIKELPEVGAEFHMMVIAKVTSVNHSAREGYDEDMRVGMQITMAQVLMAESASRERQEYRTEGKETPAKEAAETATVAGKYRS